MTRARDLGIVIGEGRPGAWNAITDVPGVRVGHATLISGEGPLVVGTGPIRTGVTVVVPRDDDDWSIPVFAGSHTLNGNGELTGLEWIRETGLLHGPIGLTNTHSVGTVRDALVGAATRSGLHGSANWALPVVGETWDGRLNDIDGQHVRPEHVAAALKDATSGPVVEGNVGGGTGMICHEFKGGIGTASRRLRADLGGWTVGVLVQANYGRRGLLRIDGVPVGEAIRTSEIPSPHSRVRTGIGDTHAGPPPGSGSIIGIVATDAPLLPGQCARLAQRAALGLARTGGLGATTSGDLFLCFATGNRDLPPSDDRPSTYEPIRLLAVPDPGLDPLIEATVEATEEAIVNTLVAAETMTGRDGITAYPLPHDRLVEVMAAAGRLRGHP